MGVMYGLTVENKDMIINKALSKSDGCYQFRGVAYRVVSGKVTHYFADGKVLECVCGFDVLVGVCSRRSDDAIKELKRLSKKIEAGND